MELVVNLCQQFDVIPELCQSVAIIHKTLSMDIQTLLPKLEGASFRVMGPFLVADLHDKETLFRSIEIEQYGMENVSQGMTTQAHCHTFHSVYKSVGLNVVSGGKEVLLPNKCLVLVLPDVEHYWVPKRVEGSVGSVDARHEQQVVMELATVV